MKTTTKTAATNRPVSAAEAFAKAQSDIKWADAAGRSVSTMNRLWRKYFAAEDRLKAALGAWA